MAATERAPRPRLRARRSTITEMEHDPAHHLTGPFLPQTPLDSAPPSPPIPRKKRVQRPRTLWSDVITGQWVVKPASSFKLLCIPVILHTAWTLLLPTPSPFAPLLLLSHPAPTSTPSDPRFQKGWNDLLFIAYHIVVWSFVRQSLTVNVARTLGKRAGVRQEAKLDRFGEQFYAVLYFTFFGVWGVRIMGQLPTWWYNTQYFWIDYPHWDMQPELKRYYLMHAAYWCQQAIVMLFRLEKPRKDYYELIAHHIVTLWLIGWSYLVNLTLIGNAVFLSMDIPDVWLALPKLLNYMRWEKTKTVVFAIFIPIWTYFRIYLNIKMLYSVWTEFDLIPEHAKRWHAPEGVWLTWWMRYQIFVPILLLLGLNLFWYYLILRIAYRSISGHGVEDARSDDEDEGEDAKTE